ncbi:Carbon monoxide dehydrogenase large chain [Tritonibacter multivorans]|uniref:Carbon monoxide dehydrogenase large chain n=2 Tax=Tritonibacter multivorans TaxID=928856 RepID=A0A0P1GI01_9RHOB|nr:Carbon monoxide dehydrogenase large chain [Tritonibacter multivorans]SFC31627.1 xanthine dehydrogenase, molybdenum binding subunit apoprotein [Tritonibacter multivorans]
MTTQAMQKFGKSQPVTRREDQRLLTGRGTYIEDSFPAGALRAFVLRSPVAHGVITHLDVAEARRAPGVAGVLTQGDLEGGMDAFMDSLVVDQLDGTPGARPARPMLAKDRVRFVGEAVAVVFADSLSQARDAAERIVLDIEDLAVKLDLAPGGVALHEGVTDNTAFDWGIGDRDATDAAFAAADHVVSLEVPDSRVIINTMEPRGCHATWDGARLHFAYSGQAVWWMKGPLAAKLGLAEDDVHVTIPDVGGAFGMKAMPYPEYFIVAHAARQFGRPVAWAAERSESMMSDHAGRDLTCHAELAFDADLKITGYRVHSRCNLGAYNSFNGQNIQTNLFSRVLTGVYNIPAAWLQVQGIYTNTTQVDAYRGAGRPEAIYVIERAIDTAARQLGVDPLDLRRRNFIARDQFPYQTVMDENYDVGDFHHVLDRLVTVADLEGFAARKAQDAEQGRLRGAGLCYYIESILGNPEETAEIEFLKGGAVNIYVGTQSNGQGHETVFAQFLADQTGLPVEDIHVIQGDSDLIPEGGGTGGSRSVTTQGTATLATVDQMVSAFTHFLAETWDIPKEDIRFEDEAFRSVSTNHVLRLSEVAELAREAGREDLMRHRAKAKLPGRSFPNGAHLAEIVIDPETGQTQLDRYTVVDDFGNLINPLLAEGQVHGGVAQGVGQLLMEAVHYDASGQLLTASFMDYAIPRANDLPMVAFHSEPLPSTQNPMGMKGCGEAGTVGAMAAVANAVQDALWPCGSRQVDMPLTPLKLWEMLHEEDRA